jgi:uncharacterized protein
MLRTLARLAAVLAVAVLTFGCSRSDDRLRVFIGVNSGSETADATEIHQFLHDWKALLKERGAAVEGATNFPTRKQLKNADVVVLYSVGEKPVSAREQADLEGFAKRGGGLVLLHDAIRCANPVWMKGMAGGAWDSAATKSRIGVMGLYFQDYRHPIIEGVANFDLDDELLYDLPITAEAKVVASSYRTATETVPQIWTYEKSNRTVVWLPGHKSSTFNLPQVRGLILRSVAWAGKKNPDSFTTTTDLASFTYPVGGPTSPEEAARKLKVDSAFDLKLVAAEPLVVKPIYVDWDPKGRMWVSTLTAGTKGQGGTGNDGVAAATNNATTDAGSIRSQIAVLEDSDGDGRMDKKTVFSGDLKFATSFVFYRDGLIVSQPPEILWMRDTDGDGAADKREMLFTGFAQENPRSAMNNLKWGLDGWIYGDQGAGGGDKVLNAAGKSFANPGNGLFRFKPDGSAIETVSSFKGESWGFDFAWDGELFFSKTYGPHIAHVMMPEKFLARGRVPKATSEKSIEDHQKVFPLVADARPEYAETTAVFTNVFGFMLYQGGAWPRRYQNSAFVCDPSVHVVHEDIITALVEGAIGFEAIRAQKNEFVAATDMWFRPILTRYGPDGAMYLLDLYTQPSQTIQAFNDSRFNDAHGRIWRIQHKLAPKAELPHLADAPSTNLVKALEHPNAWTRMTAQRLLVERADTNVTKALSLLVSSNRVGYVRVHALWALQQLHTLRETNLILGISDRHPGVQKNALRIVAERGVTLSTNLEKLVLKEAKESDDRAKLNGLFALQQGGLSKETQASILRHFNEQKDVWSKSAYLGIAMTAPMAFIKEALATDKGDHLREAVAALADHLVETGSLSNAVYLVERLGRDPKKAGPSVLQGAIMDSFTRAESPDFIPRWTPELEKAFKALLGAESSTIRYNALALVKKWDTEANLGEQAEKARKEVIEDLRWAKDDGRNRIITVIMGIPSIHAEMIPLLERLFSTNTAPAVVNHLVKEFGKSSEKAVAPMLMKHFADLNSEGKQLAISVLFKRPEWVSVLIDAIADKEVRVKDLGVDAVARLTHHPDSALAKRAREVIEEIQGPLPTEKQALIAKFIPALEKPVDLKNGSDMYRRNCAACHRLGDRDRDRDKTKDIGPELNGIGAYGPEILLTHILDPNRVVETNYLAYTITTKKDEDHYGIILSETKELLKIRNLLGDTEIRVADIASKKPSGLSIMPEGYEALGEKNLNDIIGYIIEKGPKGYRTVDLGPAFTADSRKGLFSEQSDKPSLEFKKFGLLTIDSVPFTVINPTAIADGKNLVVLKGGAGLAKSLPQRVEIPMTGNAARIHVLGGIAGAGFPNSGAGTNDPLVRAQIIYADNETEEFVFRNGYEFADYVKRIDVPGSRYVPDLIADGQLRLFSFKPKRTNEIAKIILESFDRPAAPTFVAMTAQLTERQK